MKVVGQENVDKMEKRINAGIKSKGSRKGYLGDLEAQMVVAIWKIAITIVDGEKGQIINAQQVTEKGVVLVWKGHNHYEWLREIVAKVPSKPAGFRWEYDEESSIDAQSDLDSGNVSRAESEVVEEEGWITQCRALDLPVDERFRSISKK